MWIFILTLFTFSADLTLDEIEFIGVNQFNQIELESTLEISPGVLVNRSKIAKSQANLEALYQYRGYRGVKVTSSFIQKREKDRTHKNIVQFQVIEGAPHRLNAVRLLLDEATDSRVGSSWKSTENNLLLGFPMKTNDILDQEKITEAAQWIERQLAQEEYVGVKVKNIRSTQNGVDRVDLDFFINLGDRITFGFRGNQRLSKRELMELVEEQRIVGLGDNFISAIESKIQEKYLSLGYPHVKVKSYVFDEKGRERHITYQIDEGKRIKIGSVHFEGNYFFKNDELLEIFKSNAPLLVSRNYYVEKEVSQAAEFLIDWIKSKGYLSARLIGITPTFRIGLEEEVDLAIYITEGEQTFIRKIEMVGINAVDPQEIQNILGLQVGSPLNLFAFNEGIEAVKTYYRKLGYLDMSIENESAENVVKYFQRNRVADIYVSVIEGPLFRAGDITIDGLQKTLPVIVERELQFQKNDVLKMDIVEESENRLRRLGIFVSAKIQLRDDPNHLDRKLVRIVIMESDPGIIGGGIGVRNDLGLRVFGSTAYTNIWKRNHTWSLSGSANRRFEDYCTSRTAEDVCFIEYQFRMGYSWPWFANVSELGFRPSITQEKKRYRRFDAQSTTLLLSFDRPLWKTLHLSGGLDYSLERTQQFNAESSIDNQILRIGAFTPSLTLDWRDNPLAPRKGYMVTISNEIASTHFGSQPQPFPVAYTKFQGRVDQFFPLGKSITLYLSFRTGFLRNLVNPDDYGEGVRPKIGVPLIKQFALGGAGSLRGFKSQELNFQDKIIRGTLSYVNYRSQIDFPVAGQLKFGPFVDVANLVIDRYSFGRYRYGSGFGLHYLTPVGPVNFDWGFKLDPRPGEEPHQFYFTVGVL